MTMIKRDKKFISEAFTVISMTIAFGLAASVSLHAQQRSPAPPPSTPQSRTDIYSQDMKVRGHELERERAAKRDPQAVMAEVNDDLQHLRAMNEELTLKNSANATPPDYKYVAETTMELKKRAVRLKENLASLPASGKEEKRRELKDPAKNPFNESLSMLNDLIGAFVHNPIFSDAGALDPQLAAKARRDLEDMITLSDKVRKSAEKLQKNADKSK